MSERIGDWIQTYTGRRFWPHDPRPDEIVLEDIAHALSLQCRFGGHCDRFYSVAEHSVRVSRLLPVDEAAIGLLHDASEAYLVDLPRPLKRYGRLGAAYIEVEDRLMRAIIQRFNLPVEWPDSIHRADDAMLAAEAKALMKAPPAQWARLRSDAAIVDGALGWSCQGARTAFLMRASELGIR